MVQLKSNKSNIYSVEHRKRHNEETQVKKYNKSVRVTKHAIKQNSNRFSYTKKDKIRYNFAEAMICGEHIDENKVVYKGKVYVHDGNILITVYIKS